VILTIRSERATERKFQGAKWPGNKRARERVGQGANRPESYWLIRSGEQIGPGAKRLGTPHSPPVDDLSKTCRDHGRNQWGRGVGEFGPPKIWMDHPNFLNEECDYRYVTHCSARNWVYHPYFVMNNNLDQGIGPQLWKRDCAPGRDAGTGTTSQLVTRSCRHTDNSSPVNSSHTRLVTLSTQQRIMDAGVWHL